MSARLTLPAALGIALGCSDRAAGARTAEARPDEPAAARPADSLVASAAGAEIWYTMARPDSGARGRCAARALEIRQGARRVPVPLLYTTTAPEIVNETTFRARLSDHCAPGDAYLVDLRTGRPVRER